MPSVFREAHVVERDYVPVALGEILPASNASPPGRGRHMLWASRMTRCSEVARLLAQLGGLVRIAFHHALLYSPASLAHASPLLSLTCLAIERPGSLEILTDSPTQLVSDGHAAASWFVGVNHHSPPLTTDTRSLVRADFSNSVAAVESF